ncbi:MAG: GNAT family N-acetyltransferase [Planctomycetes bacterium]|nr:GNAT family N-acetyltransferase [Planctomycetota bacterium]
MTPQDQARFPAVNLTLRSGERIMIRPLRTSDAAAMGDFYESVPREDFRFYCPHELTRDTAARTAAGADSPVGVVIVMATTPGQIAGYAWYRWEKPESPTSMFGICVRRGWQDCGAGRALIERIKEVSRAIGPPLMTLTVQQANPRAVALYQKMGFSIVRSQVRPVQLGFPPEPEYAMEMRTRV